jgi:catechol 2,3-dioxygenase-like lactoylglutathione lyase family enzyme
VRAERLDQVALWSSDRHADIRRILALVPGLSVLEESTEHTVLGTDPELGKLALYDAPGPREEEQLMHVAFRVPRVEETKDSEIEHAMHILRLPMPETDGVPELDHVALRVGDPDTSGLRWKQLGFEEVDPRVEFSVRLQLEGTALELYPGTPMPTERPLLNHVGVLVESIEPYLEAVDLELEILERADAPRSRSLFVQAPDGVRLELIQLKHAASRAA